jgi:hypothetical protein
MHMIKVMYLVRKKSLIDFFKDHIALWGFHEVILS